MRNSLANALFPRTRQAVLAATVLHPDKWWYLTDLARHLGLTPSSLQRELKALVEVGILNRREEGRQVYFRPNPDCPILPELKSIMAKTAGLTDVLRFALQSVSDSIECAFVFGSVARAEEFSASDVDLFILGTVSLADLSLALKGIQEKLGSTVNPAVYTPLEFADKISAGHHFLLTVLHDEKLFIIGDEDDLATASGRRPDPSTPDEQERT
jgi:predicted nucleotidyltransferase